MNIVLLLGSPNRKGSSALLAECFRQGAQEAGHTVEMIDVAHADIHPCTGCIHCGYEGPCSQKDEVQGIRAKILDADMMVFVTPLYYYGMSAQLKTLVDRFCAFNSSIHRKHMKSALLTVAWNISQSGGYGNGAGVWLRDARHDQALRLSPGGLSTGQSAEITPISRKQNYAWARLDTASPIKRCLYGK